MASRANRLRQHWALKIFIKPLLIGLIPAMAIAYYSNQGIQNFVTGWNPGIAKLISDNPIWILVIAWILPPVIDGLSSIISKHADENLIEIPANTLNILLSGIDNVVGLKETRFRKFLTEVVPKIKDSRESIFSEITQPRIQIAELIRGICELFNALHPKAKHKLIRVILAELVDGKVHQIPVFYPSDEPPSVDIKTLNKPNSTILTSVKRKKIVIVESIRKEITKPPKQRRYIPAVEGQPEKGSIICFPILCQQNQIPFVVSIHCDQDGLFKENSLEYYEFLLARFALRLKLEYWLIRIKEETDNA